MRQLLLDITPSRTPTLEQFIPGHNNEALLAIRQLVSKNSAEPVLYLWGSQGSGKTHLLQAAVHMACAHWATSTYRDASNIHSDTFVQHDFVAIDNVEQLSAEQQIHLFSAINHAREGRGRLLCAGHTPPAQLDLRADLSTRLGWHLVYQLIPADEIVTRTALQQRALALGFILEAPLIDYLMRHWQRDLATLLDVLNQLDYLSREQQRPVTLPLLRETLIALQNAADAGRYQAKDK